MNEIRTYYADTIKEAMLQIKYELGEDAVILESTEYVESKWLGLVKTKKAKVVAGIGINIAKPVVMKRQNESVPPLSPKVPYENNNTLNNQRVMGPNMPPAQSYANNIPDGYENILQDIDPRMVYNYGGQQPVQPQMTMPPQQPQPNFQQPQQPVNYSNVIKPGTANYNPQSVFQNSNQNSGITPNMSHAALQQQSSQPQPVQTHPASGEPYNEMIKLMQGMQDQINMLATHVKRQNVDSGSAGVCYTGKLQKAYEILKKADISEPVLNKIMNEMELIPEASKENWEKVKEHLRTKMASLFKISEPIALDQTDHGKNKMPKLVAFIGPTGVGKTTTLAKIGINFHFTKQKVVFFTIDNFKVSASEQMKVYGDIMGIPVEVIYNEAQLIPAIQKHQDADIILIDTSGRSQWANLELLELKKFLYPPNNELKFETFLVISASTRYRDMLDIAKNFNKVSFDKLIFTKTDETTTWGSFISLASEMEKPISYISTGQNVPDDIMNANFNTIINKIIEKEDN